MTPYDREVAGTSAQKQSIQKTPPRKTNTQELKANNLAMFDFGKTVLEFIRWKPIFVAELKEMNRGKVGRPYEYCDSMIACIAIVMTTITGTFRFTAGFLRVIFNLIGMKSPSPSRLAERANELADRNLLKVPKEISEQYGEDILALNVSGKISERVRNCGIDSTGISLSSINRWREKKWGSKVKDRGWLKLHALSDTDTGEIIAYALTTDKVGDCPMLKILVDAALKKGHHIDILYADNAYCSKDNWKYLCFEKKLKFVTSFRVNTRPKNNGCSARGDAARLWCSLPYKEWVKQSGYGRRWKCECVFSDFKRIFLESVSAISTQGILREMEYRVVCFNRYKTIRAGIMGVTGNGVVVA